MTKQSYIFLGLAVVFLFVALHYYSKYNSAVKKYNIVDRIVHPSRTYTVQDVMNGMKEESIQTKTINL